MDNISFQYPAWYLLLCLACGALYAVLLYLRPGALKDQPARLRLGLAVLRFLAVSLIAVLLLEPLLRRIATEVQKPVIVLARDASESVGNALGDEKSSFLERWERLAEGLSEDFEVKPYSFGEGVRPGLDTAFSDKETDIAEALAGIYSLYSGQNLGAVVLASDGIYNKGSNPLYAVSGLNAPLYSVALGDTTPQRDLLVKRVFHNRIVYLGDRFSIQVDVLAENANGARSTLRVYQVSEGGQRLLKEEAVVVNSNRFFETREFILDAPAAGVQRYRVELARIEGESNPVNNRQEIFIDVLDARQKILVLANAPHPDVTAFKQALVGNKNYEVTTAYANDFSERIEAFDFVVLHNLPSARFDLGPIFQSLQEKSIPHLFVAGSQVNFSRFNERQGLVSINNRGGSVNQVQGYWADGFGLFKISDELRSALPGFSPLTAVFGEFTPGAAGAPLLLQRIGKIDTGYPLLAMGEENGVKKGVLCAEGVWKWRLFDYLQHQNHDLFDELIGKMVQYLSVKDDKRRFRVNLPENIFDENEPVAFDAELYNRSFELINEPEAALTVEEEGGKSYDFTFNRSGSTYRLNAGVLPVGNYNFLATTSFGGERFEYQGRFSIQPVQLESFETTADHGALALLSEKYGGELLYPDGIAGLPEKIRSRETVKPVIYETALTHPALNFKWLFGLILLLLGAEWAIRRYKGAY